MQPHVVTHSFIHSQEHCSDLFRATTDATAEDVRCGQLEDALRLWVLSMATVSTTTCAVVRLTGLPGFFGLSFVMLQRQRQARFDHPFALDKRLVLNLTKRGIVAMHCTDPGRYRSPSPDGKWSQDAVPATLFVEQLAEVPKTEHQDRIQQQTLDQISDTSFCAGSGGTRGGLHSFLPGQSSTAFS